MEVQYLEIDYILIVLKVMPHPRKICEIRCRSLYISTQKGSIRKIAPLNKYPEQQTYSFAKPVASHTPVTSAAQDGQISEHVRNEAAVKLQSLARRFSVRLNAPNSPTIAILENSMKCNESQSLRAENIPDRDDQRDIDSPDDYFPGYYDENGTYIYYQSDGGEDFFGYYDDNGTYTYCEGDRSKVQFYQDFDKSELDINIHVSGSNTLGCEVSENLAHLESLVEVDGEGLDSVIETPIQAKSAPIDVIETTENMRAEKSVKFEDKNTADDIMNGLDVEHISDDDDNLSGK